MRAITCNRYGPPDEVLTASDIDEPLVGDHDVLVEVHAASVNAADWHLIRGVPHLARLQIGLRRPGFTVPGSDVAGRVAAVGTGVTTLAPGDEVFGTTFMAGFGAFAERVAVPEHLVARMPTNVGFDEAATVPLAASTALQALRDHGHLEPGQEVLVIGASGGVGTFATQIAKILRARVTGVCSTPNVDLVRSLGADDVIDRTAGPWGDAGRYDLVLQLGGRQTASDCRHLLTRHGTLVQISGDSDNRWFGPLGRIVGGRLLSGFVSQTLTTFTVRPNRADLDLLATFLRDGRLRPVIDAAYPLDRVADAVRHLEGGHTRGKVVLRTLAATRSGPASDDATRLPAGDAVSGAPGGG